jgi:hypothetical protein
MRSWWSSGLDTVDIISGAVVGLRASADRRHDRRHQGAGVPCVVSSANQAFDDRSARSTAINDQIRYDLAVRRCF